MLSTYLCERQWLRGSSAGPAYTLLDQRHCKLLMGDAMPCAAHILRLFLCNVVVNAKQHVLEAFRGIVHEAQLKSLLIEEGLGQRPSQGVRGKGGLMTGLELREEFLETEERESEG